MFLLFENLNILFLGIVVLAILSLCVYILKKGNKPHFFFSIISLFLLFVALSQPYLLKKVSSKKRAFLIDISSSMPNDDVYKKISSLYTPKNDIYLFSKKLSPIQVSLNELKDISELKNAWSNLNLNETNIKDSIENLLKKNNFKQIFLYTDGYESEDSLKNFLTKSSFDTQIFVLLPNFSKQTTINNNSNIFLNVNYNPKGNLESKSKIRMVIENHTNRDKNLKINIFKDSDKIESFNFFVNKGTFYTKDIITPPLKESISTFSIELLDEKDAQISKKVIHITANKKDNILLISNSFDDANFLEKIIKKLGYNLTSIYQIDAQSFNSINDYSFVILNNFPYRKLGEQNGNIIAKFVQDGGKFLMIGGENSFGFGGYSDSIIEGILPVSFSEPKKEIKRSNLGIVLVLDTSASMSENSKIDYLKLASKNLIQNLNDEDYVGIVGFNSTSFLVLPINKIKDYKETALKSVDNLSPFGGTNLMPALNDAINMLSQVKTGKKHIILLTDGQVPGHVKKFVDTATIVRMIGSTLSTILLGNTTYDKLLKEMASVGNGNYYEARDEKNLPNIFIEDLKLIKDSDDIKEEIFKVEINKLKNTLISNFPTLKGIVNTRAKDRAKVELYASNFTNKYPLLVTQNVESGKSIAFTSDMNGRWSKNWIEWDDIFTFWDDVFSNILSDNYKNEHNILDYNISYYVNNNKLFFDLNIFKNISFNDLSFELVLPNGKLKKLELKKLALGHFTSFLPNPQNGKYKAYLRYKERKESPIIFELNDISNSEEKYFSPNTSLLDLLVKKHFGKINPNKNDLKHQSRTLKSKSNISPIFLILALLFFILGVYRREK